MFYRNHWKIELFRFCIAVFFLISQTKKFPVTKEKKKTLELKVTKMKYENEFLQSSNDNKR